MRKDTGASASTDVGEKVIEVEKVAEQVATAACDRPYGALYWRRKAC